MVKDMGYDSLGTCAEFLNNDSHAVMLMLPARVAAEAPGLESGMAALLPLYRPL